MSAQPEQGPDLHHGGRKAAIWIVGSLVLLAALGGGAWYLSTIPDIGSTIGAILLTVFGAVAYVIPSIIAIRRKHHSVGAIIAVNLLLGWSLIGWVIALVWSLTDPSPTVRVAPQALYGQPQVYGQPQPPVQYQVGDVVNGHRFNGQDWVPLQ